MLTTVKNQFVDIRFGDFYQTVQVGHDYWWLWLKKQKSFGFEWLDFRVTMRREKRKRGSDSGYWTAYKRHKKKLYKAFVGSDDVMTDENMRRAIETIQDKIKHDRLVKEGYFEQLEQYAKR